MSDPLSALDAVSPIDGRYRAETAALAPYVSEAALFRYRVQVEVEYLIFLSRAPSVGFVPAISPDQQGELRLLYRNFGPNDAAAIAAWDRKVNHDVKAVEYWLREQLDRLGMAAWHEAIHFALTSEDVNNIAYSLMLRDARDGVLLPALSQIAGRLHELAVAEASSAMLARTHGQPATPTTMGKELAVFAARLKRAHEVLANIKLTGKLNGASGSYAAHVAALPLVDWPRFSRAFLRALDLEPILLTTQIEPHDRLAELFDALKRANTILLDLSQDLWRYISDGYLGQASTAGEVGSSTMPHKVNPIDFENSEGNLGLANALLEHFSRKLPISRLQRDLSDSTVLRSVGAALAYCLIGYKRMSKGLGKIAVNHQRLSADLAAHPEVITEAIQTILRRVGFPEPYEALKQLSRGRAITADDLAAFIANLAVDDAVKAELAALDPLRYVGLAPRLALDREREGW